MQRRTYGFWRGVLAGIVVTLAAVLALAWAFPPLRAPEVDDAMQVAPAPPGAPAAAATPGPMLTPAAGPLVDGLPGAPAHPQGATPEQPAGSPSLVPVQ
jgi:hypothetical protein